MRPFRQSTVVTLRVGPALDSAGAEYTGLVIGDLTLTKAGTSAAMAAAATLTHVANGHYSLVTIAGNTDTVGSIRIDCNKATYQIPPVEGEVIEEAIYDALFAASANAWSGAAGSAVIPRCTLVDTVTTLTNLPTIPTNWLTAAGIAADAITDAKVASDVTIASVTGAVGSVTGNVGGNVVGSVGSVVGAVGSVTGAVGSVTGAVGSVAAGGITAASIADGAIDRATFAADTGLQTIRSGTVQAGSAATITLDASASATDDYYNNCLIFITGGTGAGQVREIGDYNGTTKVATIRRNLTTALDSASTYAILPMANPMDAILADHALASSIGAAIDNTNTLVGTVGVVVGTNNDKTGYRLSATGVDEIWDELQSGHTTAGTFGRFLDSQLATMATNINTIDDFLDTEIAAILAAVDTEIAAILVDTGTDIPATLAGLFTTALTESYRADGATGSVAQLLYELLAHHAEKSITGTTLTTKKLDGTTTAATHTLNSSTVPTSITRAT